MGVHPNGGSIGFGRGGWFSKKTIRWRGCPPYPPNCGKPWCIHFAKLNQLVRYPIITNELFIVRQLASQLGITSLGSIQLLIKHNICQQKIFITKLTNEKPVVVLQLKILTDLGPRTMLFSWKCNHHVLSKGSAKKLHSTSNIKQSVSVKKMSIQRIY